jgi:LPPG:FO 2-phospho-L-lactate transferase
VSDGEELDLHFQEYWVRRGGRDEVKAIRYEGADRAARPPACSRRSPAPTRSCCARRTRSPRSGRSWPCRAFRDALFRQAFGRGGRERDRRRRAARGDGGPADARGGAEVSAAGAAAWYEGLLGAWVVDEADRGLIPRIEATGVRAAATDSIMTDDAKAEALARFALGMLA